jgi:hypothetical protein
MTTDLSDKSPGTANQPAGSAALPNPADDDLKRARFLLGIFSGLLVLLGLGYIFAHQRNPDGILSKKASTLALNAVGGASAALKAAPQDILDKSLVADLVGASSTLSLLAPRLGASADLAPILTQVDDELKGEQVHRLVLIPLFARIQSRIEAGSSGYFWEGSQDRWLELLFWTMAGTLVFLLSELKRHYVYPYEHDPSKVGQTKRNFKEFTPWYFANLFRGPFIALVILLAVSSVSFDAIGLTIDISSAPVTVWVVLAAILGYYSRLADKQLDIIAGYFLKQAWEVVNPGAKKAAEAKAAQAGTAGGGQGTK